MGNRSRTILVYALLAVFAFWLAVNMLSSWHRGQFSTAGMFGLLLVLMVLWLVGAVLGILRKNL
jgi:hypothetical protein